MKNLRRFYILDTVAEKVVGGFDAPNYTMAFRVFNEMLEKNDNLKKYQDSYRLCAERYDYECPETYEEVLDITEFCVE